MPNRNYKRGAAKEYDICHALEAVGYEAQRTAGSHGSFDVIAVGPTGIRLIQSKRIEKGGKWRPEYEIAKKGLRLLPKLPHVSRECWIWEDGEGWILQEVI